MAWLSVWSEVQMICIWSSWCHCRPIISCPVKSRMVYLSSAGLPRLSWKALRLAHVNEGSHSFTCHPHVYPHMEWAILPLLPSHTASLHCAYFPFPLSQGGWVGWEARWNAEVFCPSEDVVSSVHVWLLSGTSMSGSRCIRSRYLMKLTLCCSSLNQTRLDMTPVTVMSRYRLHWHLPTQQRQQSLLSHWLPWERCQLVVKLWFWQFD